MQKVSHVIVISLLIQHILCVLVAYQRQGPVAAAEGVSVAPAGNESVGSALVACPRCTRRTHAKLGQM